MKEDNFHTPVLVEEVLKYLLVNPSGIYIDGTLGGGGHSSEILKRLTSNAKLIGIDLDQEAVEKAGNRLSAFQKQIILKKGNFVEIANILDSLGFDQVDGILLDLGVSYHQIDSAERGFSYIKSGPLDMRMSKDAEMSAITIINNYSEKELEKIFKEFGEERRAHFIAKAIVKDRTKNPISTTDQIVKIIESEISFQYRIKSLARIFQAIRIAVNKELENLRSFLDQSLQLLKSGGRLVIIAYHSLEDRMVKEFFAEQSNPCHCPPEFPMCVCGKEPTIRLLTRKVIRPKEDEIKLNPRSRSARLRAVEKI